VSPWLAMDRTSASRSRRQFAISVTRRTMAARRSFSRKRRRASSDSAAARSALVACRRASCAVTGDAAWSVAGDAFVIFSCLVNYSDSG
jgi:hypothetical protein